VEVGPALSSQPLQLVLPLAADDTGLQRFALAAGSPGSPDYAHYESIARLARRFGASQLTRARVWRYLRGAGATHVRIDATGLFADATMTVGAAQRAFGTELARFRARDGALFIAPSDASAAEVAGHVPAPLRGLATGVVGLDTTPITSSVAVPVRQDSGVVAPSSVLLYSGTPSGCAGAEALQSYTPNQYLTAYDYEPLHDAGVEGQGERVAVIATEGFNTGDIDAFANCFGLGVPPLDTQLVGISHSPAPGSETTLDLEMLDAAAPRLKDLDVYEASDDFASTLRAMAAPLQNASREPQIVSMSVGICEALLPSGPVRAAAEAAFAEASAAGITYLASSGDLGSDACANGQLGVDYPASSPWVTGVGGTSFELDSANQLTEQLVWNEGGLAGGGGLSRLFTRPAYQDGVDPGDGRAVPDVSMLADTFPGYAIYCTAQARGCNPSNPWESFGGTSAAAPLLAGGFALVDQELHASGREPLGLANPLLYALGVSSARGAVFDDVTSGSNDIEPGGVPLGCCSAGVGYDDASGWGSVNITSFAHAAVTSQPPLVDVGLSIPGRQHPLSSGRINAIVSCSAACLLGARASVAVGRDRPFELNSRSFKLAAAGRMTIVLQLSGGQLRTLRSGRSHHDRITATVYGELFDSTVFGLSGDLGESVQSQTGPEKLRIS
jgi:kumamolisin